MSELMVGQSTFSRSALAFARQASQAPQPAPAAPAARKPQAAQDQLMLAHGGKPAANASPESQVKDLDRRIGNANRMLQAHIEAGDPNNVADRIRNHRDNLVASRDLLAAQAKAQNADKPADLSKLSNKDLIARIDAGGTKAERLALRQEAFARGRDLGRRMGNADRMIAAHAANGDPNQVVARMQAHRAGLAASREALFAAGLR